MFRTLACLKSQSLGSGEDGVCEREERVYWFKKERRSNGGIGEERSENLIVGFGGRGRRKRIQNLKPCIIENLGTSIGKMYGIGVYGIGHVWNTV